MTTTNPPLADHLAADVLTDAEAARLLRAGPLARLLHPVRVHLAGCAVLSALGAAAGLVPYIAIAEIARAVLGTGDPAAVASTVWLWVALGTAGGVLRLVLVFASSRLGHYADAATLHDIRERIVRHLGVLPLGWFRAGGSGAVKKTMTDDLEEMHMLIAHSLGEMIGAATAMAVGFTYLAVVDWRLALVMLLVLLAMLVCFRVAMRSSSGHIARLLAAERRIGAASVEYADGIAVVKAFGTGGRLLRRYRTAVREQTEAMGAWAAETRFSSAAARVLGSEVTMLVVAVAVGLAMVQTGSLSPTDLPPFLVVGVGLPTSIVPAIHGAQGLRKGRVAAAHIESLLSRQALPAPARPEHPRGHAVEFDRVCFSYDGETDAIAGVSAVCEPGSVTAIVGPSGAGKTTLAHLLPRFSDVTGGAIRIGGADVRAIPTSELLSKMALVFQDVVLLHDTVTENIRIGRPGATDAEVRRAAVAARVDDVVRRLPQGYDTVLGGAAAGLSGGERQRVTVARAILADAPIVVLDEATAALDPDAETAVQEALATLAAGKTVLVIAHRLHTIAGADQILVLAGGRLVERGTHAELLARGELYARMWSTQQAGAST